MPCPIPSSSTFPLPLHRGKGTPQERTVFEGRIKDMGRYLDRGLDRGSFYVELPLDESRELHPFDLHTFVQDALDLRHRFRISADEFSRIGFEPPQRVHGAQRGAWQAPVWGYERVSLLRLREDDLLHRRLPELRREAFREQQDVGGL